MKLSVKRLLAVALALVLCLSLLPGIAMAADSYVKVTGLSDVTSGGKFIIVADGFAMTTAMASGKFAGVAVTPSNNTLSGSLPVWNFETVTGGIAISVDGQYLAYGTSGTNFLLQAEPYTWTVSVGDNGFVIKSAAYNKRGIFLQTSSSRFGAYSTTNTSGYVFDLELYKLADGTVCDHDYTRTVITTVTCTQDGQESYTCTKCGDNYTKTIASTGHDYVNRICTKCGLAVAIDPAKIIPEAYALAEGSSLGYDSILTGKIVTVDEEYSSSYKNITVTIAVEGYEEQPIKCYRLKGNGIEELVVGDEISVFGSIKNYKGTVEFDTGCTLTTNPNDVPGDAGEILAAAYALAEGESLDGTYTLTGEITEIKDIYNPTFGNISVWIEVEGYPEMPILCYRLAGEGADKLLVEDIITVTGSITNYKGTVEFKQGCTLDNVIPGGGSAPVAPEDPKQIVEEAYALAEGKALPYIATLTGEITEIGTYNETYGDITLKIVVFGKEFECYALKGENVQALQVGDIITVTGTIKNYYGKIEFDKPTLVENPVPPSVKTVTISGAVVTGADGDTTIELLNGEEVVATVTASGKEGTYSIENVAAGTYTLKVSKLNHVTREYTVTVDADLTLDVKIHLVGDVDGNGKINVGDVSKINSHIKSGTLTDEYMILCANVNGGKLNMGDVSTLYAHIKGTKKLY